MTTTSSEINQKLRDLAWYGGGVLELPRGQYWIDDTIVVPESCVIRGEFHSMPMGTARFPLSTPGNVNIDKSFRTGTCFNVTTTLPAVRLDGDMSGVEGITFYYPNQSETSPQYYAPSIVVDSASQDYLMGCQIRNVLLVNSFTGIEAGRGRSIIGQLSIEGIRGQPLLNGITIDKCLDVCRIKDVHFWAYWSGIAYVWMSKNWSTALKLLRSDWQVVDDFFAYGYAIGVQLAANESGGATNGVFSNVQIDASAIALDFNVISTPGCLFSNCNFVSTRAPFPNDPRFAHQITLPVWAKNSTRADQARASLMMQNCSFWGDLQRAIQWEHPGELVLSSSKVCPTSSPPIFANNGKVRAYACSFGTGQGTGGRVTVV